MKNSAPIERIKERVLKAKRRIERGKNIEYEKQVIQRLENTKVALLEKQQFKQHREANQ